MPGRSTTCPYLSRVSCIVLQLLPEICLLHLRGHSKGRAASTWLSSHCYCCNAPVGCPCCTCCCCCCRCCCRAAGVCGCCCCCCGCGCCTFCWAAREGLRLPILHAAAVAAACPHQSANSLLLRSGLRSDTAKHASLQVRRK